MGISARTTLPFFFSTALALCPPPGALLPPPTLESVSSNFSIPESVFSRLSFLGNNSFAIQASIGDVNVYEYEHSAPGRELNQTLFKTKSRIASATKMITSLALALSSDLISLEDPITKYIPGLDEDLYAGVTVGSLADHTSGLGRFGYVGDLALVGANTSALGLPRINTTLPGCDPFPGGRVCTETEVLAMFNHPSYAPNSPNSGPLYSNIGYNLIGMALEAAHNRSYESIVQDLILSPLGMTSSTFETPANNGSALLPRLPADRTWFAANFGNFNPTGGLWSTTEDMLKLLQSLLNNDLLTASETRKWLQPRALLPSLHQIVGKSWEILRPTDIPVGFPRPLTLYSKAGNVNGYGAYAVLVPEYDLSLIILAAGGQAIQGAVVELLGVVSRPLVAYADQLARSQAAAKYAGTYRLAGDNGTNSTGTSLTLSASSGPGLEISSFVVGNRPILPALAGAAGVPLNNFSARLYATDPDSVGTEQEVWRMLLDRKEDQTAFAELNCASWALTDTIRYERERLDTFVFDVQEDGAVGVELLGWRLTLEKVV